MEEYTKIDQYLLGQLDAVELKAFEQQLQNDPQLAEQVEEQRKAVQFLEIVRDNKIKANLQAIHKEVQGPTQPQLTPKKGKSRTLRWLLSAAAIGLLCIVIYMLLPSSTSPQELYASYYEVYPVTITARDQSTDPQLVQASQLYQQQQYQAALSAFQNLANQNDDQIIHLAIGLCQLELNQTEAAIPQLQKMQVDPIYGEAAQWYLALAQLKSNQVEACKSTLQGIEQQAEFFQQAQELLERISD